MVCGHVIECGEVIRFHFDVIDHVFGHFLCVYHLCMEFTIVGWDDTVKIHIVFGKSASLIETCELDDATSDDLIL
jgi:hypothetical protein